MASDDSSSLSGYISFAHQPLSETSSKSLLKSILRTPNGRKSESPSANRRQNDSLQTQLSSSSATDLVVKRSVEENLVDTVATGMKKVLQISDKMGVTGMVKKPLVNQQKSRELWISDSVSPRCFQCDKKFTTIRRRHHCRMCGQVFCNQCSSHRINADLIGLQDNRQHRLCDNCAKEVSQHQTNNRGANDLQLFSSQQQQQRHPLISPQIEFTSCPSSSELLTASDHLYHHQQFSSTTAAATSLMINMSRSYEATTRSIVEESASTIATIEGTNSSSSPLLIDNNFIGLRRPSSHPDLLSNITLDQDSSFLPVNADTLPTKLNNTTISSSSGNNNRLWTPKLKRDQNRRDSTTATPTTAVVSKRPSLLPGIDSAHFMRRRRSSESGGDLIHRPSHHLLDKNILQAASKSAWLKQTWCEMTYRSSGTTSATTTTRTDSISGNSEDIQSVHNLLPSASSDLTIKTTTTGIVGSGGGGRGSSLTSPDELLLVNQKGAPIVTHRYKMRLYPNCVMGYQLVDWLITNNKSHHRDKATLICQTYVELGLLTSIQSAEDKNFHDDNSLYSVKDLSSEEMSHFFLPSESAAQEEREEPQWLREISTTQTQNDFDALIDDYENLFYIPGTPGGGDRSSMSRSYMDFIGPVRTGPIIHEHTYRGGLKESVLGEAEKNLFKHVLRHHTRRLIMEMVFDRYLDEHWIDCIVNLAETVTQQLRVNSYSAQDRMDVRNYVHVKKIHSGLEYKGEVHAGLVFTGSVAIRGMKTTLRNPRILLLACPMEYTRRDNGMISFDQHLGQAEESVRNYIHRIVAVDPELVISQRSIPESAKALLFSKGITVIHNVKLINMLRLARLLSATIHQSIEQLTYSNNRKLGVCELFQVKYSRLVNGLDKSLIYIDTGCRHLHNSILLHSPHEHELTFAKEILQFAIFICHNLRLELAFLRSSNLCSSPIQCSISVLHPERAAATAQQLCFIEERNQLTFYYPSTIRKLTEPIVGLFHMIQYKTFSISPAISVYSTFLDSFISKKYSLRESFSKMVAYTPSQQLQRMLALKSRVIKVKNDCAKSSHQLYSSLPRRFSPSDERYHILHYLHEPLPNPTAWSARYLTSSCLPKHHPPPPSHVELRLLHFRTQGSSKQHRRITTVFGFINRFLRPNSHPPNDVEQTEEEKLEIERNEMLDNPFELRHHQQIAFLYSENTTDAQSFRIEDFLEPDIVRLKFYDFKLDTTLGTFLERRCFRRQTFPLESFAGRSIPLLNSCKFVHGNGCVRMNVQQMVLINPSDQPVINIWNWCSQCDWSTPPREMDAATWHLSFGKFLHLLLNASLRCHYVDDTTNTNDSIITTHPHDICPHTIHNGLKLCFGRSNVVAVFEYIPIQLYEVCLPPLNVHWHKLDVLPTDLVEMARELAKKYYDVFAEVHNQIVKLFNQSHATNQETFDLEELQKEMKEKEKPEIIEKVQNITLIITEGSNDIYDNSLIDSSTTLEEKVALLIELTGEIKKWLFEYVQLFESRVNKILKQRKETIKKRATVPSPSNKDVASSRPSSGAAGPPRSQTPRAIPSQMSQPQFGAFLDSVNPHHLNKDGDELLSHSSEHQIGLRIGIDNNMITDTTTTTTTTANNLKPSQNNIESEKSISHSPAANGCGEQVEWKPKEINEHNRYTVDGSSFIQRPVFSIGELQEEFKVDDFDSARLSHASSRRHLPIEDTTTPADKSALPFRSWFVRNQNNEKRILQCIFSDFEHFPKVETVYHGLLINEQEISTIIAFALSTRDYHNKLLALKAVRAYQQHPDKSHRVESSVISMSATTATQDEPTATYSGFNFPPTPKPSRKSGFIKTIQSFVSGFNKNSSNPLIDNVPSIGYKSMLMSSEGGRASPNLFLQTSSPTEEIGGGGGGGLMTDNEALMNSEYKIHKNPSHIRQRSQLDGRSLNFTGSADNLDFSTEPHIPQCFEDGSSKFYCQSYFAYEFMRLRESIIPDGEMSYILSLSRCFVWQAQGGKTKASFFKTKDERFIIKELQETELETFVKSMSAYYFRYMSDVVENKGFTALAKILGIYTLGYQNRVTGNAAKLNVIVMENLFYKRRLSKIFDLKGSLRNRLVQQKKPTAGGGGGGVSISGGDYGVSYSGADFESFISHATSASVVTTSSGLLFDNNSTLPSQMSNTISSTGGQSTNLLNHHPTDNQPVYMDENFIRESINKPYYVRQHSRLALLTALRADANFLSRLQIMDYSLIVGVDQDTGELVVGLVDYLRRFTIEKWFESMLKSQLKSNVPPTIVSSIAYRDRFLSQMAKYFLLVPDHWHDLLRVPPLNSVNVSEEWYKSVCNN